MAPAPCEAGTWRPFILGACCHAPHATYPGSGPETALRVSPRTAPIRFCSRWGLPCRFRYRSRGGLLPHPFTLTAETAAVCFLWHFPWGRPRRPLAGTVSPWSPDFPHPQPFDSRWCGRPAGWQAYKGVRDPKGKSTCSRYPQLPRNELERRAVGSMAAKPVERMPRSTSAADLRDNLAAIGGRCRVHTLGAMAGIVLEDGAASGAAT